MEALKRCQEELAEAARVLREQVTESAAAGASRCVGVGGLGATMPLFAARSALSYANVPLLRTGRCQADSRRSAVVRCLHP